MSAPASSRGQWLVAGGAVCLLTLWNARDLLEAWSHSPFDRLGGVAAGVWLLPLLLLARRAEPRGGFFLGGLALSALGTLAELNVLAYAAAALALAGFAGTRRGGLPWLLSAVSWMPAFGWALRFAGPAVANGLRVAVALAGVALVLRGVREVASTEAIV